MKYYKVVCKCGHVGRRNYIPIEFAIVAENGREASKIARLRPRVKHHHKDAILFVEKVSYEEYKNLLKQNSEDPYLKCKSKAEQKATCDLVDRLCFDAHSENVKYDKAERAKRVFFKLKKYKSHIKSIVTESNEYCYGVI